MKKGYQVIEPPLLNGILARTKNFDVAVAILSWLLDHLRVELKDRLLQAQIELIRVASHGTSVYPALGIHYERDEPEDLGPVVDAAIEKLLRERSAWDLLSYIGDGQTAWPEVSEKLMQPTG